MKTYLGVWLSNPHDPDCPVHDNNSSLGASFEAINGLKSHSLCLDPDSFLGKTLPKLARELKLTTITTEFLEFLGVKKEDICEKYVFVGDETVTVIYANSREAADDLYARVFQSYAAFSRQEVFQA